MRMKKQLQREITAAQRENIRLRNDNEFLKAEKQTYKLALSQAKRDLIAARKAEAAARKMAADARALADKLLYINDVLCAELQNCDRCIDTVQMGLEQKSARVDVLNRITGPMV